MAGGVVGREFVDSADDDDHVEKEDVVEQMDGEVGHSPLGQTLSGEVVDALGDFADVHCQNAGSPDGIHVWRLLGFKRV